MCSRERLGQQQRDGRSARSEQGFKRQALGRGRRPAGSLLGLAELQGRSRAGWALRCDPGVRGGRTLFAHLAQGSALAQAVKGLQALSVRCLSDLGLTPRAGGSPVPSPHTRVCRGLFLLGKGDSGGGASTAEQTAAALSSPSNKQRRLPVPGLEDQEGVPAAGGSLQKSCCPTSEGGAQATTVLVPILARGRGDGPVVSLSRLGISGFRGDPMGGSKEALCYPERLPASHGGPGAPSSSRALGSHPCVSLGLILRVRMVS